MAVNIVNVADIAGKTDTLQLSASMQPICTCLANEVRKVNALYVSNIDNTEPIAVRVAIKDATNQSGDKASPDGYYFLCYDLSVPKGATIDVISKSVYLEESDTLELLSGKSDALSAVCSYEIIKQA